jgi:transposase-like protein
MMDKSAEKAKIIRAYRSGRTTYSKLGAKYGYSSNTIWRWVMAGKKGIDKGHLALQSQVSLQEEYGPA